MKVKSMIHILLSNYNEGLALLKIKIRAYPQGQLALHEQNLIKALEKNAETEIWQTIAKMDASDQSTDPISEKIALNLLQATLTKSRDQRNTLIQNAELTLQRCGADAQASQPLEAWLENLKSEGKVKIFEQTIWQNHPLATKNDGFSGLDPLNRTNHFLGS